MTDADLEAKPFHVSIPVPPGGLIPLGALRDLLEALDYLPDTALVTVQSDGLHYEETS